MNLRLALDPVWSPEWLWLGYATLLRGTLFLVLAFAGAIVLRRAPSAVRAGIWASALLVLLPLPQLRALPLHWSLHLVPDPLARPMINIGHTLVMQSSNEAAAVPWTTVVAGVYLLGVALVLARLLYGTALLIRLAARCEPVGESDWLALLNDTARELGVRRSVRLLRSRAVEVPITWGTLRPAILLPAGADEWPQAQRRAVLLHELAHVNRLDALLSLIGHWACALWWFHPGAWSAARRLHAERERACDERVLLAGVLPSDYAECLLRVADAAAGRRNLGPTIVAAGLHGHSDLHARIRRILVADETPRRASALHAAAVGVIVMAALSTGSMRLSPHPAVLWQALTSEQWATRAYAAESIARFGDRASLARLEQSLRQESEGAVLAHVTFGTQLRARQARPVVRFGWPADPHDVSPSSMR